MAADGAIPARRVGERWLFSAPAVNQWLRGPSNGEREDSLPARLEAIAEHLAAIQEQLRWLADALAATIRPTGPVGTIRHIDAGIAFDLEQLPDLALLEESYIQHVLDRCEGNKSRAAETLGIDPSTLYRKLAR
jgi:transcriptional regulator of acetoin/glycerol metabolism